MQRLMLVIMGVLLYCGVASAQGTITGSEYFIDQDPGPGHGKHITIVAGDTVSAIDSLPTVGLSWGYHFLFVRTYNDSMGWSIAQTQPFYITGQDTITAAEYFIDSDPGPGNGKAVSITPAGTVSDTASFGTTGLSSGNHFLFVRTYSNAMGWSIAQTAPFYINGPRTQIISAEYFIDSDPGVGLGTAITNINYPVDSISDSVSIVPTGCLDSGFHYLWVRTRTSDGNWSIAQGDSFFISNNPKATIALAVVEPAICNNHSGSISLTPATGLGPTTYSWSPNVGTTDTVTGLASGWYAVTVTDQGGCSVVQHYQVGLLPCPTTQPLFYGISFNDTAGSPIVSPGSLFSFGTVVNSYSSNHNFGVGSDGADPTLLYQTNTGKLYGTTAQGGMALYSYDPATGYDNCLPFSNLNTPYIGNYTLAEAYNSNLYGVTDTGGANGTGFVFMRDTLSNCSKVLDLTDSSGSQPNSGFLPVPSGRLVGTMKAGGRNGHGNIFSYDPVANTFTDVHDFTNTGGPADILLVATNGKVYGVTDSGSADYGSLYQLDPNTNGYQKLYSFSGTSGYHPDAMIQLGNGHILGITHAGGSVILGLGAIFTYNIGTGVFTEVYQFDSLTAGGGAASNLIQASNGKVYGITHAGGSVILGFGCLFSFDPVTNTFTKLFSLKDTTGFGAGYSNSAYIMQASDGNIYGVLHDGGDSLSGTIFKFNLSDSTFTKLYDFVHTTAGNPVHIVQGFNSITGSRPLAAFTAMPKRGCTPLAVAFTDSSFNSPTSWNWSFGDGSGSPAQNPVHTYTTGGTFIVTEIAINTSGSDTITDTIRVFPTPASSAIVTNATSDTSANGGAALAVIGGTQPYTFAWSNNSTAQNLTGVEPGIYSLIITDSNGCKSYDTVVIIAAGLEPAASFTLSPNQGCAPLTVNFTDHSTNNPTHWSWSFGDGSALSTSPGPTHVYITGGIFVVTETAINPSGGSTFSDTVTVYPSPVSSVNVLNASSSTADNGGIAVAVTSGTPPYTFSWSNSASTQNLTGVEPGTYYLTITDANSCKSFDTAVIISTGIGSVNKNNFQVRLYPNPASDQLTIESDEFLVDKPVIKLTDATGRQLNVDCDWNYGKVILNTSALSQGFYLITIQVNDAVFGSRFVKE